jgi:gliding motility-associated-like protein
VECACTTSAGELDVTPQEICGAGPAVAAYDGANEVLDGDDVVDFILHAGDNVPILSNTIPSFNYTGLLSYGVTYYISARAGNNNGSGGVDPADPCLSVTPGAPVTFYQVPSATLAGGGDFCEGEAVEMTVTVTGGVAPWQLTYMNTQGQQQTITVPFSPYTFTETPDGTTLYSLQTVADAHCTGAGVSGIAAFTERSQPFAVSPSVVTDPTNTFVTICFTIAGGDPATYSVTGWPGTITGNQFCSDPIPCDQGSYQFLLQDAYACGVDTIAGPIVCDCTSSAGIMDQNPISLCEFETATGLPALVTQLDGNDVLMYVLHTGNGAALGTIIDFNSVPEFTYDPANMDCGVTYYLSSVVGDDDGTGMADLTDDCLSVAVGTPVVFNCLPTAGISGGGPICLGQTIIAHFTLGYGLYDVVVSDGTNNITLPNIANSHPWPLSPAQTTTYTLVSVYSLTTGCFNTASGSITVTVNMPVFAGTAAAPYALCAGEADLVNLADLLTGEDQGGVWTETSATPSTSGAFNAAAGTFNTATQVAGTYKFRYFMDAQPPCTDDFETATIIIHPLPVADAGEQQTLTCNAPDVQIGGTGSSTGANFTYTWTMLGSPAVIGTDPVIQVAQPGTYVLTVTNTQTGCEAKDQVVVIQDMDAPVFTLFVKDVTCFGYADGIIFVETVTGGKPPYLFSINEGPFTSQQQFGNLAGGQYLVIIEDANGCQSQAMAEVIEPPVLTAELETTISETLNGDYFMEWGDEAVITLLSSYAIADLDTIIWSPAEYVQCNDIFCQSVTVAPQEGALFTVTVEAGPCSATSQLRILMRKSRPVFIPTVFSPNNDGHNDVLYIFAGRQVERILSFNIFNRWGEPVFQATEFPPNDFKFGWDGYHRGKPEDPGVFAYYVEVLYKDGYVEMIEGSFSLVR